MKHCPECRRTYADDTLNYCLDDGATLLYGPRSDEPPTAVLSATKTQSEAATEEYDAPRISQPDSSATTGRDVVVPVRRANRAWLAAAFFAVLILAGVFVYRNSSRSIVDSPIVTSAADERKPSSKVYWEMGDAERSAFIREQAQHIQKLIGDDLTDFDDEAIQAIKNEIDDYVAEKDSLSQKPFEEGLRVIYGRATQYAPLITQAYETQQLPPALGLYQAMIESEYRFDLTSDIGTVGLFQFMPKTAQKYGMKPADYHDPNKQADAAAHYMSDLTSDFGEGKSNSTLGLLAFNIGENSVREYLRQLRGRSVTERSFWAIYHFRDALKEPLSDDGRRYVPRFFAAAIIGESPREFDLSTPPLTTLRVK